MLSRANSLALCQSYSRLLRQSFSTNAARLGLHKTLYTAECTAIGARAGHVKSSDGVLDLHLAVPKGLGGSGGNLTNPEQLFAAGYSACFGGALSLAARLASVKLPETTAVTAIVHIGNKEAIEGLFLDVELKVKADGVAKPELKKLVESAHQICPYSKATKNNVEVKLTVE